MKYVDKSIKYYVDNLSAKTPTPGGGSVAALLGAVGCGLLCMVAHFTMDRDGYNGYKERARKVIEEVRRIKSQLLSLVDDDIEAYGRLSNALKRYKYNKLKVQPSLKKAVLPAAKVCLYTHKAAVGALELAYAGSKSLISDVSVAIYVLDAAFESALVNVNVNLRDIKDKD